MNKYDKIINSLKENGFTITEVEDSIEYNGCKAHIFKGKGIRGYVGEKSIDEQFNDSRYVDSILAENEEAFDKWSKAPVQLAPDGSDRFIENLLKELEFLGSEEGFKLSNSYDYELMFTEEWEK